MGTPSTKANDPKPALGGWVIAALICTALVGCVWLISWCITWVMSGKADAGLANCLTAIAVVWGLFHTKWNFSLSRNRFKGHEVDGVHRVPQRRYGPWWITLWAACFLGCIACIVVIILDEHGNVRIGIPLFSGLGLLTFWLGLRLLWPRLTLHPPRVVLNERTKGSVRGTFYQSCKRDIEHASVTVKVGYDKVNTSRTPDPDGDPGSTQQVSQWVFVALAETTQRAKLESDRHNKQEFVVEFSLAMNDVPDHLVIETRTSFGGRWDYKARLLSALA